MVFSSRLKELLVANKTNWQQVSKELSIGKNQQKYWEDKDSAPDGKTLVKLAQYFQVSTDYLLGNDDLMKRALNIVSGNNSNNVTDSENVINNSPNATLIANDDDSELTKQEEELIDLYRNFSLEQQVKLLTYAFKLREE